MSSGLTWVWTGKVVPLCHVIVVMTTCDFWIRTVVTNSGTIMFVCFCLVRTENMPTKICHIKNIFFLNFCSKHLKLVQCMWFFFCTFFFSWCVYKILEVHVSFSSPFFFFAVLFLSLNCTSGGVFDITPRCEAVILASWTTIK